MEYTEVVALRRVLAARCIFLLLILIIATQPLWAHAVLMDSKPKANATVAGSNLPIWLRFNVRVDGSRSRLHLIAADGTTVPMNALKQPTPDTLETHAAGLKAGSYKLQWRVLASDGHISSGEIDFSVN